MSRQRKRDAFLSGGEANLATRPEGAEGLESERLKAKLGEMLLERELLEAKIAALEGNRPSARPRSRR
jgi:transposase